MPRVRWIRYLLFTTPVVLVGILLYLLLELFIPRSSYFQYFIGDPNRWEAAGPWRLNKIRVIYLWSFDKDGGKFFKTAYRDKDEKIRLLNIFVGDYLQESKFPPTIMKDTEGNTINVQDYNYPLHVGSHIEVSHIYSAKYSEKNEKELCNLNEKVRVFCDKVKVFLDQKKHNGEYIRSKRFPSGYDLISLSIKEVD